LGTVDWIHWGAGFNGGSGVYPGVDRKANGSNLISDVAAVVYAYPPGAYQSDGRLASWTDGTPTQSATHAHGYIWVDDQPTSGFMFHAPADPSLRTLSIYCGGWETVGTLTAHLSDESARDYVQDAPRQDAGGYTVLFTLRYRAASPGQTLTIHYLITSCPDEAGCGSVDLVAAWLQ
jgi:hypothetical protein